MLNHFEKAYCQAIIALKEKKYRQAASCFENAAPYYSDNKEFTLLMETNKMLLVVKEKLAEEENEEIIIKEAFAHGKETELLG